MAAGHGVRFEGADHAAGEPDAVGPALAAGFGEHAVGGVDADDVGVGEDGVQKGAGGRPGPAGEVEE